MMLCHEESHTQEDEGMHDDAWHNVKTKYNDDAR